MERLALIGVSHRRGGAAALEQWHARHGQSWSALAAFPEVAFLGTCNRAELLVVLPEGMDVARARAVLAPPGGAGGYAYCGEAALEHLCRVAASLDSLNPGEDQVMAQVREAMEAARAAGTLGPQLGFAFDAAMRAAKRVRREVRIAPSNTSLFSLARPELERHLAVGDTVAVLGAGEMGTLAARSLAARAATDLLIVNRSPERAAALAAELGARHTSLAAFLAANSSARAVVCATPVAGLLDAAALDRLPELRVVVDLGMPANLDAGAARARGIVVWDIDSLRGLGDRRREEIRARLAEAEMIVAEEVEDALQAWAEQSLGPAFRVLRERYRETIERVAAGSVPADVADTLAHRFAHL
ncbi:MAG TPA: NAD(P)-binding domain-containing protein, partial [Deinococcales bacterium]|nr:NAD(P)-binding domain-containing protein [Deinococcales bacterium]